MKNISSIFDLSDFCDRHCVAAKSTAPASNEMEAIALELADRILDIDIVPPQSAIYEALLLVSMEAPDEGIRQAAQNSLCKQLKFLSAKKPEVAIGMAGALLSSLFIKDERKPDILKSIMEMPALDAPMINRLARETHFMNEAQRVEFVARAVDVLADTPYEFVQAMREMVDAVGRGVCPVTDMMDTKLDTYTQSPVYMAEVLEREYGVQIRSVPAAANKADHINPNG